MRRAYAESIEQRYWLSQDLVDPPLSVSQIWTDGQFTFLRSTAQEAPALYALSPQNPDEPILVNYELTPDGLYIVDHVMSAGWAQVGDVRGEWGLWDTPSLDRLDDLQPARPCRSSDLNVPVPVGRTAPSGPGFWDRPVGRVVGAVLVGVAGYGLWRSVTPRAEHCGGCPVSSRPLERVRSGPGPCCLQRRRGYCPPAPRCS